MIAVVDACVVVGILLQKEKNRKFYQILQEAELVITPDLYVSELTNAFWKYQNAKIRTRDECIELIQDGINYIDKFIDSREIWEESFAEGVNHKHSVYDMIYMVAARRNDGILVTSDSKLAAICKKSRVQVCC